MIVSHVAAIVLAAGKGTRMKANKVNKVAYNLAEKPMIAYTVETLRKARVHQIVAVIGFASSSVKKALGDSVTYAVQANPQGTGHALKVGLKQLLPEIEEVVSLYGDDSAFYPANLIESLINSHRETNAAVTVVTIDKANPTGLGRIVRSKSGQIESIVEEKNATTAERQITEINTGLYCFNRKFIDEAVKKIKPNPVTQEYYLTDVIEIARNENRTINALKWPDPGIWFGVNTPDEYQEADKKMRQIASSAS